MGCGAPLPANYQQIVENRVQSSLIDPESARFQFEGTRMSWRSHKGKAYGCYIIKVWVNAKNRMGGYAGRQPYWFAIRDGVIISSATPDSVPESDFNHPMPESWCWN